MGHSSQVVSSFVPRAIQLADVSDCDFQVVSSSPHHSNLIIVESAFEDPESFVPERWYSRPELIKDRRAFVPFGVGKYTAVCMICARISTGMLLQLTA